MNIKDEKRETQKIKKFLVEDLFNFKVNDLTLTRAVSSNINRKIKIRVKYIQSSIGITYRIYLLYNDGTLIKSIDINPFKQDLDIEYTREVKDDYCDKINEYHIKSDGYDVVLTFSYYSNKVNFYLIEGDDIFNSPELFKESEVLEIKNNLSTVSELLNSYINSLQTDSSNLGKIERLKEMNSEIKDADSLITGDIIQLKLDSSLITCIYLYNVGENYVFCDLPSFRLDKAFTNNYNLNIEDVEGALYCYNIFDCLFVNTGGRGLNKLLNDIINYSRLNFIYSNYPENFLNNLYKEFMKELVNTNKSEGKF